uniref:Neurotransmitter-gated ion-channel ligand-binding domain-containing protein n=1 Tax=Plectus sambesii TaxID=2011161 RepID=A0A914XF62_9BILA
MQNYTKEIRPVKDVDQTIEVILHPTLEYLVEVDELRESFTALFWFSMLWYDDFLVWNAKDFNDLDIIHLPATAIWRPDLMIYGAVKLEYALALESTIAKVQSNGKVVMELTQVVKMFCPFNIELFPFDTQNCAIRIGSWSFRSNRVNFQPLKPEGNTDFLKDQPEWSVISFTARMIDTEYGDLDQNITGENQTFSELSYNFIFQRKPIYYIFNLIIPSFIITLLSLIGLFSPFSSSTERQEKV